MSFTLTQLEEAVQEVDGSWSEFGWGDIDVDIDGVTYSAKSVQRIGGSEGSGEYAAVIFSIDGRTFRKEGYYASHYGTDWDGELEEVESYEKTVIDYRAI